MPRRQAEDSRQEYDGIHHNMQDDGSSDRTGFFTRKREKNSGNQGGSHPGRGSVGRGEQQGIQQESTG